MKLHTISGSPNPRRVTIYLAEKGINVPTIEVDRNNRQHKSPEFLLLNPAGRVPVLELDDGRSIPESAAIVEYLEELHPSNSMIGDNPEDRAIVRSLERVANDLIVRSHLWIMHSNPVVSAWVPEQIPAVAAAVRPLVDQLLQALEASIGSKSYLAGESVTIADCSLFALFDACRERFDVSLADGYPRLGEWYSRFAQRPSAHH